MATASASGRSNRDGGTAKATVADHISQSLRSTSNLLRLMQQSSSAQAARALSLNLDSLIGARHLNISNGKIVHVPDKLCNIDQLIKLPKNLLAKTHTIKNTEKILEQMPQVVSSLDVYVEKGLKSIPHLQTVVQLLANMESSQLKSLSQIQHPQQESESLHQRKDVD